MVNNVVAVVGFDKGTGFIKAVTSCDIEDSQRYAKYYRGIGYSARVLGYEEFVKVQEKEKKLRSEIIW